MTKVGDCLFYGCNQLIAAYIPQHLQLAQDVFQNVDKGFVMYNDREQFDALPIVRLAREPYFQFSNIEMGVEVFPGARDIINTMLNSKSNEFWR